MVDAEEYLSVLDGGVGFSACWCGVFVVDDGYGVSGVSR